MLDESPVDRGRKLELAVERYFQDEGYATERNSRLMGHSGRSHEVDVLASRTIGALTFHVMVECKNWQGAVDKDVVSKIDVVRADLNLSTAILVAPGGAQPGAEALAKQLGIQIWAGEEIRLHLGQGALEGLAVREGRRVELGIPTGLSSDYILRLAYSLRRGLFRKERIEALGLVHVNCYEIELTSVRLHGFFRRSEKATMTWAWFDSFTGKLLLTWRARPELAQVEALPTLPELHQARSILREITRIPAEAAAKSTEAAKARWRSRFQDYGIPLDAASASGEVARLIAVPFVVIVFADASDRRRVAVYHAGLHPGREVEALSAAYTAIVSKLLPWLPRPCQSCGALIPPNGEHRCEAREDATETSLDEGDEIPINHSR